MAASITKGQTFSSTETITNTKLHNLVDLATISGIVNAEIASNASIADTKLATIATAGVVQGTALTGLANIPSGAGLIPAANLPSTSSFTAGMIMLWSGSSATIPSGWTICDGTLSTPDLRDRFVVGAGSSYAVGATGGATTINLAHVHSVSNDGWGTGGAPTSGRIATWTEGVSCSSGGINAGSGGSATQDVLNPYYALCYIQKT